MRILSSFTHPQLLNVEDGSFEFSGYLILPGPISYLEVDISIVMCRYIFKDLW